MNYRMISYTLGWVLLFEAAFLAVPTISALAFREDAVMAFIWSIIACLTASALLLLSKPKSTLLRARDGFVIVSLSWLALSIFGALPFLISGTIPNFIDALFETVSGFTTTGASILSDVEALPRSILVWRSFTHWVGGMGVLVFLIAFLPLSGGTNMHIMKAESPGPSVSKLVPRVRTTALLLYSIYFAMTVLEFILLLCGGMTVFEALCTSFATAGTGGFAFYNDGMASFSPYLQIVPAVFMLLFSINFNSYFLLLNRKWREAFSVEVRSFLLIVALAVGVITYNIYPMYSSVSDSLRHSLFSVSSIVSTTGFSTVDFDLWPQLSRVILVLLMFMGACAGSTGGGMKVSRLLLMFKDLGRQLSAALHPKRVKRLTVDGKPVEEGTLSSVYAFFFCYMLLMVVSMLLISSDAPDFTTSFTASVATLSNIGPGLSAVGPTQNFGFFSPLSKLVLIFNMLAGRLELFPILLLFAPSTWKK